MSSAFFFISKVVWFLAKPLHSLLFCLLAWLGCRRLGWRRLGGVFLAVLLLYGGAILLTPLPELSVRVLENRFPVPVVAEGRTRFQTHLKPVGGSGRGCG
jgi:hypothetical protein